MKVRMDTVGGCLGGGGGGGRGGGGGVGMGGLIKIK